MSYKECTKCGETRHFTEFYKQARGMYGTRSVCKECDKAYQRSRPTTSQRPTFVNKQHPYNVTTEEDAAYGSDLIAAQQDFIYAR